jgi:hypothetical protein
MGAASDLVALMTGSGILAESETGYEPWREGRAQVAEGWDASGARLVFIGMRGAQVSNDHYPYYELLFREPVPGDGLHLVSSQRFFFDVAGLEGFEWTQLWQLLTLALTPLLLVGFIGVAWFRDRRVWVDDGVPSPD